MDENLRPKAYSIGSRIEHLNGVLLVDAPNNKSGKDDIFLFPSFQSKGYSYVYYDRDSTLNGVYARDSFYFRLEPFSFDHLDKYRPAGFELGGNHVLGRHLSRSSPKRCLLQEEDQSLGFQPTDTGQTAFDTYGDKGNYTGDISLTQQVVFWGRANSFTWELPLIRRTFTFMPEETTASAEQFDLEEDREGEYPVPQVRGEDVRINWRPYRDSMLVRSAEAPFQLYKTDEHQLEGLLVSDAGWAQRGRLAVMAGRPMSDPRFLHLVRFRPVADTMSVNINALQADDRLALETSNVFGDIDFDEQEGFFKANDEYVITTLPYNQYTTSINEFTWEMDGSSRINFEVAGR